MPMQPDISAPAVDSAIVRPSTSGGKPAVAGRNIAILCTAAFLVLGAWAILFPYTGETDALLHLVSARDALRDPPLALSAWARPAFLVAIIVPAQFGLLPARLAMALVTVVLIWQTIRLAEDLGIANAFLAGPLLLWQPYVFALGADTMTELPFALGTVLAIRLWLRGRYAASAVVAGVLPMVRPEGFLLAGIWAIVILFSRCTGSWRRRASAFAATGIGMAAWILLCWILTPMHDPLYILHSWSWPARSYAVYGRGPLNHYLAAWPLYCGFPLLALFTIGILPSLRPRMALPWLIWLLIIGVHSLLYWRGWFASIGIKRVLACSAPATALICLYGWNLAGTLVRAARWRILTPRALGVATAAAATLWMFGQYLLDPTHLYPLPVLSCIRYVRARNLLTPGRTLFHASPIVSVEFVDAADSAHLIEIGYDNQRARQILDDLPPGSIGIWDSRQATYRHSLSIEELSRSGFRVLYTSDLIAHEATDSLLVEGWWEQLRCVVLEKREGPSPGRPEP